MDQDWEIALLVYPELERNKKILSKFWNVRRNKGIFKNPNRKRIQEKCNLP